mmetsp:Transcript_26006/g.47424  ORF Transcript_26006/g.47424 Transcript_26006/m.47424 type:complete len:790 (-) Transcript_26006:314-2683(-)
MTDIETPPPAGSRAKDLPGVTRYIKDRGLIKYKNKLLEYGIENIPDMLDPEVLSDKDLVDEIGMTPGDLRRFHLPPPKVHEQLPEHKMETDHLDPARLAKIENASNEQAHEGYAEFCLFIRKLKAGRHFMRMEGDGGQHNCLINMKSDNQGLKYMTHSGKVSLLFRDLVKVVDLGHMDHSSPLQLAVEKRMKGAQTAKAMMLVFKDPSSPSIGKHEIESLKHKYDAGADLLKFAAYCLHDENHIMTRPGVSRSASQVSVHVASSLGSSAGVRGNGMDVLLLISDTVEGKAINVQGFRTAMKYSHKHKETHKNFVEKSGAGDSSLTSTPSSFKMNSSSSIAHHFGWLHHLYRPHHHPNHPPPRFHNGTKAEIMYDPSFHIEVSFKDTANPGFEVRSHLKTPCTVFRPGMFLRAKILDWDDEKECYDLDYLDGPYLGDESPDGHKAFAMKQHPDAKYSLHGVRPAYVSVDMADNYGSHFPFVLLLASFVQCFCFFYYVYHVQDEPLEATTPIGGPPLWWMRVVDEFPSCEDLRPQWWRLWSYQLVHAGSSHIFNNMVMQLLFGLPINMVHGNIRFFFMYELGVVAGSLCFVLIGGGQGALVGCSGGVYAIFGMHVSELIMNWGSTNKGLLNHWTRLLVMAIILGLDFYLHEVNPSATTSYTAHVGGFLGGAVMGIVLLDNLEVTWLESHFILPGAWAFAIAITAWAVYNYSYYFPPEAQIWPVDENTCCVQLQNCVNDVTSAELDEDEFGFFRCISGTYVTKQNGRTLLEHCSDFVEYAALQRTRSANGEL